jgi:hypothetical protein
LPADRQAPGQSPAASAIATRRPSRPWARSARALAAHRGARGRIRGVELLRHGRRLSAMAPIPTRSRSPWASSPCCRPCAGRRPTPSSPPTVSPAATRSRTAPAARRLHVARILRQAMTGRPPPRPVQS